MEPESLPRTLRSAWLSRLHGTVLVGALGFMGAFLWTHRTEAAELLERAELLPFLAAGLTIFAFVWAQTRVSVELLRAVGGEVPTRPAMRVFLSSLLAKYIPGKVWIAGLRASFLREHGVPVVLTLVALVLENVLLLTCALGLLGLTSALPGDAGLGPLAPLPAALALVPAAVIGLHPRLLHVPLRLAARRLGHRGALPDLSRRTALVLLAAYTATWLLLGAGTWLLALALGHELGAASIPFFAASYGLAVVAGFAALVAPAGIGVREGAFVLATRGLLSPTEALALALAVRLVAALAEPCAAFVAAWAARGGSGSRG